MFIRDGIIYRSDVLSAVPGVLHGFSGRAGGVSVLEHTRSLNLTVGLGDPDETVRENTGIFCRAVSGGLFGAEAGVKAHQIHSTKIRLLDASHAGEGAVRTAAEGGECDGFVTDAPGVLPMIRVADCVPILFAGLKDGDPSRPVVAAVHAGWRGTAGGIAPKAVRLMREMGCSSLRCAVGPHIGACCYEVGEDFVEAVASLCGREFASRHIRPVFLPDGSRSPKPHADLAGMNRELLLGEGLADEQIDFSPDCTACSDPASYYSHRRMKGVRGTQGAGIVILPHLSPVP